MRVRTGASIAVTFAVALSLSACSVFTTPQTRQHYDASDGVSVTVGDVRVLNAIVFTEDGEDGNFLATAANSGDSDVDLNLQYLSGGDKVNVALEVPAGETVSFGVEGAQVFLPGIDALPGTLLSIYFQYSDRPGKQIDVPVLDTALAQYDGLLPTPTPTPTHTPAPTPTPTPTP